MKIPHTVMILIGAGALLLGSPSAAFASGPVEVDMSGPVASDQSAVSGSLVTDTVTAPSATSVNGGSTAGLTTDTLSRYYTDSPDLLQVYTSTGSGTSAVTGVVVGPSDVVAGATVTLQPSAGGTATTVTSDSNGGFAFVNIPVSSSGTTYTIAVSAPGYGSYTVANDLYMPDLTYDMTVNLTSAAQSYDASQTVSQDTQDTAPNGTLARYVSFYRPPPTIKVAIFSQDSSCAGSGSSYTVKDYPFGYYSLKVTASEIVHSWPEAVVRANMVAITNYAWYFLRHPPGSSYDVTNTTSFQCFETWQKVPTSWPGWLAGVLGDSSLRLSGDIEITQFRAGNYECNDPNFPQNGNVLSQWGSLALNKLCGYSYYKNIDTYYYTGSFVSNEAPPVPNTSYSRPSGAVKFNFPSQVKDGGGNISNVGWKYTLEEYIGRPVFGWYVIYDKGWKWSSRSIPTTFTYQTGTCTEYRVRASNPVATSRYASFNGGGAICPG